MNNNNPEFKREDYEHGTDEYVSDCHRLPDFFKWPKALTWEPDGKDNGFPFFGCLIFIALLVGFGWVCYRLGRAVISMIF